MLITANTGFRLAIYAADRDASRKGVCSKTRANKAVCFKHQYSTLIVTPMAPAAAPLASASASSSVVLPIKFAARVRSLSL